MFIEYTLSLVQLTAGPEHDVVFIECTLSLVQLTAGPEHDAVHPSSSMKQSHGSAQLRCQALAVFAGPTAGTPVSTVPVPLPCPNSLTAQLSEQNVAVVPFDKALLDRVELGTGVGRLVGRELRMQVNKLYSVFG